MIGLIFRTSIITLLSLVCSPNLIAQEIELNPPFGDSTYTEYSVFAPDVASPDDYKDNVIVVFHGFLSAVPNGTYKRIRKKFLKTHTTIGINYDPLDVDGTINFLQDVNRKHLQDRHVTVAGTSLGGFWARYFGHVIEADKVVILNPVVNPTTQLVKHLDSYQTNKRRGRKYFITQMALDSYQKIDVVPMSNVATLLIVAKDDEQQSYNTSLEAYGEQPMTTIQVYDEGGHSINLKKHAALQRIADYVNQK